MTWRVEGMFCPHCEQTILGALSGLPGLSNVRVSYRASTLSADWDRALLSEKQLADILANHGYTLKAPRSPLRDALGFAGGVAALILLFFAVDRSPLGTWIAAFPTAKAGMSLGALFLVGLMTSLHCVAMCGGINVASAGNTRRSAILYNLGRVVSYTLVGAIVGALGSAFSLSTAVQAGIQLFAAAFMLAMALNLLGCFRFLPSLRLPGRLSGLFRSRSSFVIGLANGLMPCGPLQAMQLFALSTGSWYMGALSMFCFSLGTVPLMLGVGLISGTLNRRFAGPMRIACAGRRHGHEHAAKRAVSGRICRSCRRTARKHGGWRRLFFGRRSACAYHARLSQLCPNHRKGRHSRPLDAHRRQPRFKRLQRSARHPRIQHSKGPRAGRQHHRVHPGRNRHISVFLLDGHDPLFHYR